MVKSQTIKVHRNCLINSKALSKLRGLIVFRAALPKIYFKNFFILSLQKKKYLRAISV